MIRVCCGMLLYAINEGTVKFMSEDMSGNHFFAYLDRTKPGAMKVCPYCGTKLDIFVGGGRE